MSEKRVVITGIGPVTAIGHGRDEFTAALFEGKSGIGKLSWRDPSKQKTTMAAEIRNFEIRKYLETEKTYLDRSSQLALAALSLALRDAGIDPASWQGRKPGLVLGTAFGSLETMTIFFADLLQKGPRLVKPFLFPHAYANTAISLAAIEFGLDGFHLNFSSGMISGACAVLAAYDRIRLGKEEVILAGGYEALSTALFLGYESQKELSPGPGGTEHCAPFGRSRNGFVLGEGSGVIALEELEHALRRGAHIYAEICGAGLAASSPATPAPSNAPCRAMTQALRAADISPGESLYVLANANGSIIGDRAEGQALRHLFGENPRCRIGTVKPMLGETLGAAGALQIVSAVVAIEKKHLPPALNLEEPEEGFALPFVGDRALAWETNTVLVNSLDSGGAAVTFVLRAWNRQS